MASSWNNYSGFRFKVGGSTTTGKNSQVYIIINGASKSASVEYIKVDGKNKVVSCYSNCICDSECSCESTCGCDSQCYCNNQGHCGCDGAGYCSCAASYETGCDDNCNDAGWDACPSACASVCKTLG